MNNVKMLKLADRLDKAIYAVLLIFAIASCVSSTLIHNATHVLFFLCVCRIFVALPQRELVWKYKTLAIVFSLFLLMLTVSALYGGNFYEAVRSDVFFYNYNLLLPFIVIFVISRENQLIWIMRCMLVSIVAADFYIFWQVSQGISRPISFIKASVMTTAMMYIILLPSLFVILTKWRKMSILQSVLYSFATILTLIAFILNGTRGAWLAVLVTFPLFLFFYRIQWKKAMVVIGVGAVLLCSTCILLPGALQRVQSIGDMHDVSQAERVRMWHSAIYMGIDHPVLGVGLGNYAEQYRGNYISAEAREPNQRHAHNSFLQFFGENGVAGLLAYCALFGYILVWAWRHRGTKYADMLFLSTSALLLYSLTDYTYAGYDAMRIYWLFVGLCLRGTELEKAHQS